MDHVTDTTLTTVSTAAVNSLNSKLRTVRNAFQTHHDSIPDAVLNYGVVEKDDASILTLMGTIDAAVATELHELLVGCVSRKHHLIICMTDVLHFDTAGAATIIDVYAAARSHALGFVLVDVSLNAGQTINLYCLNQVLPMCKRLEDAELHIQRHRQTPNPGNPGGRTSPTI